MAYTAVDEKREEDVGVEHVVADWKKPNVPEELMLHFQNRIISSDLLRACCCSSLCSLTKSKYQLKSRESYRRGRTNSCQGA